MIALNPRGRYTCAYCFQPIRDTEGCVDYVIRGAHAVLHHHCNIARLVALAMAEIMAS